MGGCRGSGSTPLRFSDFWMQVSRQRNVNRAHPRMTRNKRWRKTSYCRITHGGLANLVAGLASKRHAFGIVLLQQNITVAVSAFFGLSLPHLDMFLDGIDFGL